VPPPGIAGDAFSGFSATTASVVMRSAAIKAFAGWRAALRTTPGGQPAYSVLAVKFWLTSRSRVPSQYSSAGQSSWAIVAS